jgi:tetratricopeptide (TPR) repeat protein
MKDKDRIFKIMAFVVFLVFLVIAGGCRQSADVDIPQEEMEETAAAETVQEDTTDNSSDSEDEKQQEQEDIETEDPPLEEEEEIPEEISSAVDEAGQLFNQGMYSEAASLYRDIKVLVEESDMTPESKEGLIIDIEEKYSQAREIIEAAQIHHSSAMNLMYEKRFEEAKEELQAALDIYPGYQEALDAMASIEALEGLE